MPAPRPPHIIEFTVPHVLTADQFDELEDLTFMQFETAHAAWPISLKITSTLLETFPDASEETKDPSRADTPVKVESTVISVATSSEWDVVSEERIRGIIRNILVEIVGGGIEIKRS
ncbi:hypothetical protein IAU60_001981 [Kwoniella sp. DSM 27419]